MNLHPGLWWKGAVCGYCTFYGLFWVAFMVRGACAVPLLVYFEGYQYKLIELMGRRTSDAHGSVLFDRWANPLRKCIHRGQG